MPKFRYPLKPLEHMMATQFADASIPGTYSPVTKNVKVYQHGVRKRWGYTSDRSLGVKVYDIIPYQTALGNRYALYLTTSGMCLRTADSYTLLTDSAGNATAFTVPDKERWSHTAVDNNLIFTNGNVNVQYFNYLTSATKVYNVNATYAVKARYCTAFADRLILADTYSGGLRNPVLVQYSANTNPLQFDSGTDATAGSFELLETEDYITGLGRCGPMLGIFKRDSITFYERSGDSTSPLRRYSISTGIGSSAPYSIVEVLGTVVFLGKDDFYLINGNQPEPMGEGMRYKFYDIVGETEATSTWGFVNPTENEVVWIANTSEGQFAFVWDYKHKEWYLYQFTVEITGAGAGAI